MTKFDTSESLPQIFKKNRLGILPDSRGTYVIGNFNLYEKLPERLDTKKKITYMEFPDSFETIDIKNITSEQTALNAAVISNILEDFLDETGLVSTISGRMGSGVFSFSIGEQNAKIQINVNNSQIEIDGGYENTNIVSIVEAKNVIHSDFLIRQLYYPLRTWGIKIRKPIRPIFLTYSNNIFRLLEYSFSDIYDYNSIYLLNEKYYSFENPNITLKEINQVIKDVYLVTEDKTIPFPQANDFDKVVSLLEQVKKSPLSPSDIAENFGFDIRQSDYYFNAARYLGLVEKQKNEYGKTVIHLSTLGKRIFDKGYSYKQRQLFFVDLILQHQIFNEIIKLAMKNGVIPELEYIEKKMKELNCCTDELLKRRASTVFGWIKWILKLINE